MSDRERKNVMLMASLRAGGLEQRVRVADLSKGGLKVKGCACTRVGEQVTIELPSVGWLTATVAWTRPDSFGLCFAAEIDPDAPRQAVTGTYVRPPPPPPPSLRRVA